MALEGVLVETLLVHRIELARARVEQGLVDMADERTNPHMRHKPAQLVTHLIAALLLEEMLAVGQNHPPVAHVNLAKQSLVQQVKSKNRIVVAPPVGLVDHRSHIVGNCDAAHFEFGNANDFYRVLTAVGIFRYDIAQLVARVDASLVVDHALARTRIEIKQALVAIGHFHLYIDLVVDETDGNGIHKILLRHAEVDGVAVHLCLCAQAKDKDEQQDGLYSSFHAGAKIRKKCRTAKRMALNLSLFLLLCFPAFSRPYIYNIIRCASPLP